MGGGRGGAEGEREGEMGGGRGGEEGEREGEVEGGRGSEAEGGGVGVAEGEGMAEGEWMELRCDGRREVGGAVVGVVKGGKEEGEGAEKEGRQEAEEQRQELENIQLIIMWCLVQCIYDDIILTSSDHMCILSNSITQS